jgi:hypothetical protein
VGVARKTDAVGKMFVFGGYAGANIDVNEIWSLHLDKFAWQRLTAKDAPRYSSTSIRNMLSALLTCFACASRLHSPRRCAGICVYDKVLLVYGGYSIGAKVRHQVL